VGEGGRAKPGMEELNTNKLPRWVGWEGGAQRASSLGERSLN
jgi:hypothetical protein